MPVIACLYNGVLIDYSTTDASISSDVAGYFIR